MTLVNSDPGPKQIKSACAMASRVSLSGFTRRGFKRTSRTGEVLAEMLVSPSTTEPFSSTASTVTSAAVDG